MSDKFQGKYRIDSARLKNWDYASNGAYFITICTDNREHYFGEIENGKMKISPAGAIAHVLWHQIKNHTKNIELGEFIVMPNHVHGILILDGNGLDGEGKGAKERGADGEAEGEANREGEGKSTDVACNVSTISTASTISIASTGSAISTASTADIPEKNQKMAAIAPKSNSISTIIRSYKSAVTNYCNRLGIEFAWQTRFHDHIIRNDEAFHRISTYIKNNPGNWKEDKLQ